MDWISAHTMLSDALTKSMKPDLLLAVLHVFGKKLTRTRTDDEQNIDP